MTALYWNAPSSPAYYTDAANWRVGSSSGPVSSAAPTSSDDVYFSASSSLIGCTFDSHVTVQSFTANDPNGTFILGPSYINSFEISVSTLFDVTSAGTNQKAIFAQWNSTSNEPVVRLFTTPGAGGNTSVQIGDVQMGAIEVNGSTTGTTKLFANTGISVHAFKCYLLQINTGTAEFSVTYCNGAILGYPSNTSTGHIAIYMPVAMYKKLDAQFPSSKPIYMYGGFYSSTSAGINYDLVWASDTQLRACGAAASLLFQAGPIPPYMGVPVQPKQFPHLYNYIGESSDGTSVSSGGVLQISANYVGGSNACPLRAYSVTSTAAGSVSGSFTRGIELVSDPSTIRYTYLTIPGGSGSAPGFNVQGDSTHQATLSGTSGALAQGYLAYTNPSSLNVQTYYTTITNVNAVSTGGQYIAYTDDGNINGGNNTGWTFAPSQSGFLAFLF